MSHNHAFHPDAKARRDMFVQCLQNVSSRDKSDVAPVMIHSSTEFGWHILTDASIALRSNDDLLERW